MPIIKAKSSDNLNAARLLIDNHIYSPSVHCSYYSVYMLSMYVLCHKCNISYENQEKESKGRDSHFYVTENVAKDLDKKNHISMLDFLTWYNKLKMLRRRSDYLNQAIKNKEANKAYKLADDIIHLLTNKYNII
ncbi:hypothetical protein M1P97_09140 [Parabacteroides sp. GYB001]|uniref:hypothetical protein n=1 Tax=Parabacteroides leei TaxID=2939491 RepID=UPI002017F250|nr:hypothetical protein [Parabacteroides leei]MCL3851449.1 hypothetical protein [Parabacteroides leei]